MTLKKFAAYSILMTISFYLYVRESRVSTRQGSILHFDQRYAPANNQQRTTVRFLNYTKAVRPRNPMSLHCAVYEENLRERLDQWSRIENRGLESA